MLTLFTIPKPFRDHFARIQCNAIDSWTRLHPDCQIILLGDESGTESFARRRGLDHVADVPRSQFGTPLVNGLFEVAQRHARHGILCFINADIILLDDFMASVGRVARSGKPFLMAGRRWDTPVDFDLEFAEGWQSRLRQHVRKRGKRHGPGGIDYFVHPKGVLGELPPFAIGRTIYDNWLLYHAVRRGLRLIDASSQVTAIHQNHDYSHDPGGRSNVWEGPEAERNRALSGGPHHIYNLNNSPWLLTPFGVLPAWTFRHLKRRLKCAIRERRLQIKGNTSLSHSAAKLAPDTTFVSEPLEAVGGRRG